MEVCVCVGGVAGRGSFALQQAKECEGNSPERPPSHPSAVVGRRPCSRPRPAAGDRAGRPLAESHLAGVSKALRASVLFDPLIPVLGRRPREIARKDRKCFPPALFMTVKHGAQRPHVPAL